MEQETLMFAECRKSKFGTDLKTEEQQSSQPLPRRVNNGARKTLHRHLCVKDKYIHIYITPGHAVRVCMQVHTHARVLGVKTWF